MPEATPKQEISPNESNATRSEILALIPTLMTVVEGICALTRADGAVIAACDHYGLLCLASVGNAPPVDSRLQPESGFTRECLETSRVVLCEDAERDSRIVPSIARVLQLRSALAVPIISEEESLLGVIEVFSSQPSAFGAADIGALKHIAQSLAPVLACWPARNQGPATPSPVDLFTRSYTPSLSEELPGSPPLPIPGPSDAQADVPTTTVADSSKRDTSRFLQVARKLTAPECLLVMSVLGLLVLFLFIRSRLGEIKTLPDTPSVWASNEVSRSVEGTVRDGAARALLEAPNSKMSYSPLRPAVAGITSPPSHNGEDKFHKSDFPKRTVRLREQKVVIFSSLDPARYRTRKHTSEVLSPVFSGPVIDHARSMPIEVSNEPIAATSATVVPAIPALIKPNAILRTDFVLDRTLKGHSSWVTSLAFSSDGQRLASGSWDQTVKLWDVSTGEEHTIGSKMQEVQTLAFSRDGRWFAVENASNTVTLWDAATGKEVRTLRSDRPLSALGANWVYSMTFSPDSRWLASAVDDKTIRLWDVTTGQGVRDFTGLRRPVMYTAFSPDGRWLASGNEDRTIGIWDVSTGEIVRTLKAHKKPIYTVVFSPTGRLLASAGADKSIKLWDFATGREVRTLVGHDNSVTSLAFSPDSRWLASASWDKSVKVWDVDTGRELQTLEGHDRPVYSVAFDPRGRWLASGSEDGTIELWRFGGGADHFMNKGVGQ